MQPISIKLIGFTKHNTEREGRVWAGWQKESYQGTNIWIEAFCIQNFFWSFFSGKENVDPLLQKGKVFFSNCVEEKILFCGQRDYIHLHILLWKQKYIRVFWGNSILEDTHFVIVCYTNNLSPELHILEFVGFELQ